MNTLKDKIKQEIGFLGNQKSSVSVICMRIFYHISDSITEVNLRSGCNHNQKQINDISSQCADTIEVLLNNLQNMNYYYTDEEICELIYQIIIKNVKYI